MNGSSFRTVLTSPETTLTPTLRIPHKPHAQVRAKELRRASTSAREVVLVAHCEPGPRQEVMLTKRGESDATTGAKTVAERGVVGLEQRYGGELEIVVPNAMVR